MSLFQVYLIGGGVILAAVTLLWLLSLYLKDASIVDIFWGPGFVLSGWVYYANTTGFPARKLLIMGLVSVWGLRLAWHIGRRNIGKGEDFRYQQWRQQYGARWWWLSYLRVFVLQGVIMWLVSAPLLVAQFLRTASAVDLAGLPGGGAVAGGVLF